MLTVGLAGGCGWSRYWRRKSPGHPPDAISGERDLLVSVRGFVAPSTRSRAANSGAKAIVGSSALLEMGAGLAEHLPS